MDALRRCSALLRGYYRRMLIGHGQCPSDAPKGLAPHDRRRRIIATIGASSGNLVEWFDFYI